MKCYFAGSCNPHDHSFVEACFSHSLKEAKAFMWKNSFRVTDECEGDYMDLWVTYQKEHNSLFDTSKTEPYLVSDKKTLREMGWSLEGEHECDICGLFAMGMDEFTVCDTCGQCAKCGFDDECEEHT